MGMKDTAKTLGTRLKLDSHHAIERFGVLFGLIVLSSVVIFSGTGVSAFANNRETLSSTALYTPTFITSKTGIGGDVAGVFVSEDRTRAMVLMHFDDTAKVSANAEDYRGFVTGSSKNLDQQTLKSNIDGSVYLFGSTGYMGVMLDSDEPFHPQVLDLTMRANTELVYKEEEATSGDLPADGSFQKYDQWRVFVNPGGSAATVAQSLGSEKVDPGAIFNEIVISVEEEKIRQSLDSQLKIMRTDLNRINDATAELERTTADSGSLRLATPEVPVQIAGDEVTGEPGSGGTESTLDLKTDYVLPMGYDFDWQGGSVNDGYLKGLLPEGTNYAGYLAQRSTETREDFQVNQMKWLLSDGTDLRSDYDRDNPMVEPLVEITNKLSQAYQDYYTNKKKYQVDLYTELLDLEVNLRNVESNFTKNDAQDAVRPY